MVEGREVTDAKPKSRKVAWVVLGVVLLVAAVVVWVNASDIWSFVAYRGPLPRIEFWGAPSQGAVPIPPPPYTDPRRPPRPRPQLLREPGATVGGHFAVEFKGDKDEHWLDSIVAESLAKQRVVRFQTKWTKRWSWLPGDDSIIEPCSEAEVRELIRRMHGKTGERP